MAGKTRTFIAVAVPDKLGEKLVRLQSLLAVELEGVRWAPPSFHVTLAFLGDVDVADVNRVCRAAAEAAALVESFDLRIEGLGCFPDPKKARVLWVGLTGPGVEPLAILQKGVAAAVTKVGCPPEDDRFHPHITLGRIKVGRAPSPDLTPLLRHYRTWSAGSIEVTEAVVFASTLTADGPAYTPLSTAKLEGRKPGTTA
ncbi:MAG: RNA 2',3'-cyclic phosphodiesterase [Isosphaeraceae bacterium]|nr:RNA 2',3'-cyclic phosphodiesterase [Isosphaeraceae bacterium]